MFDEADSREVWRSMRDEVLSLPYELWVGVIIRIGKGRVGLVEIT